jgi:PAS domain S-box-containing protein
LFILNPHGACLGKNKNNIGTLLSSKAIKDLLIIIAALVVFSSIVFTANEQQIDFEYLFFMLLVAFVGLIYFSIRRWVELKEAVAERKKAVRNMQKSRAQLSAVLDGVPDIIIQVDTSMRILWANKSALNRSPQAIGMLCSNAFATIGDSVIERYARSSMITGIIEKGIDYQPTMSGVDGESYWEGIGVPLHNQDNTIFGAIAIARDLTDRMRVEHTWNLLASIVESTDDAIFGIAFDGSILSWNTGAEQIYGYKSEEIIGKPVTTLLPLEERSHALNIIDQVIRKQKIQRYDAMRVTKDRKTLYASITVFPFVDASNHKIGVSTIERNITDSKLAEEALRQSEEKFRKLVETAPDGILLTNNLGEIIEVNDAFSLMFGHPRSKLIGENLFVILQKDNYRELADELLPDIIDNRKAATKEIDSIKQNGKAITIELAAAAIEDENNNILGVIAIIRDVTIRKQYQFELQQSKEQMQSLAIHLQSVTEEERKRIAFEIHDELGYALTAVKLDLAWLVKKLKLDEDTSYNEKAKSMAEMIDTTIQKVRTISTQLRPSILDHFGLVAAIEWQAKEFQKHTALRCRLKIEVEDVGIPDPFATAIFRIFQETLTNIARHANATRVDVSLREIPIGLELKVADNGKGFDVNYKGKKGERKSLGLLGMRERAVSVNADVILESKIGVGTAVTLKIPIELKGEKND